MKIVMLDWDGVVVDQEYRPTKDIRVTVQQLLNSEITIVPNSDTPIPRLRRFCESTLGMTAETVIGERGAIVAIANRTLRPVYIEGIEQCREQLTRVFSERGHAVYVGDSTVWVRGKKLFEPNRRIVLIDDLRQQTLSCFLFSTDEQGLPRVDTIWADEAMALATTVKLPAGLSPWDYNPTYGIAIANVADVSKTDGYRLLRSEYPDAAFFMVGDSDSDIIADESVSHCAVGNATETLKSRANFVARTPFTEGLEECLLWILKS